MKILALDMASKTGWAHSDGASGVADFTAHKLLEDKLLAFYGWLDKLLLDHPTHLIVYEQAHFRGGAPTRHGVGFETALRMLARSYRISVDFCHTATLKKHATGRGNATKDEMMVAAVAEHPTIRLQDDNHVDALWLLHWAQCNREAA